MSKKVLVAFSGGIDSTYCIISLKELGYDVKAIHFVHGGINNVARCEKMARLLNVELIILDVSHMFVHVFDHIRSELSNLRLPNPCVHCNKIIKFDFVVKYALENGFDYLATGHYAQIHTLPNGNKTIMKAIDTTKEQSYFLNQINPEMLNHVIFPLGNMMKSDVYAYMNMHNIELPASGESFDLCFTGGDNFQNFCKSHFDVDIEGIVSDGHTVLTTVRNSELISLNQRFQFKGKRHYVTSKRLTDDKKCEIIISDNRDGNVAEIHVDDINIFVETIPEQLDFVIRYHTQPVSGHFDKLNKIVCFDNPTYNSGPGQYIVAYHNNYIVFGCKIV
jgi:tRNA-specific 2-thiouridylase